MIGPLRSIDMIAARSFAADEWPTVEAMHRPAFVGTGAQAADQLRALAQVLGLAA